MHRCLGGALALALIAALAFPAAATPPGLNGKIVWQREPLTRNAFPRLFVAEPDGSGARQVFAASRRRGEYEGTFSPTDANVMFFNRIRRAPFSEDIYRGNLATGEVTPVTTAPSADIAPTVSPDGTKLAYFRVRRPRRLDPDVPPPPERIHVANLDGSGDRAITSGRRRSIDPDWSPDGTRIVYTEIRIVGRDRPPLFRIAVINADGSGRRALTPFARRDAINAKWMPDGQTIVFERRQERATRSDIVAMSADGGPVRTILATRAWETNPVPSPDGTRIVFTSDRDRRGRERLGPGFEVYTMAVDGSDIVRLTNNRRPDVFPDWQRLP
jgi:Tol biopolymer transport system component